MLSIGKYDTSLSQKQVNHVWALDIKELFGKKTKIRVQIHNTNYSGNLSTSWAFTNFHISKDPYSWGVNNIKTLSGLDVGAVDSEIEIDLDDLEIDSRTYDSIYFLMAAFDYHTTEYAYNPATTITITPYIIDQNNKVIATDMDGFNTSDYYTKLEVDEKLGTSGKYITCWGDSLTAGGGWTTTLGNLAGMPVYNGGTGGESARTIVARQGADVMEVDNLTIPADTTAVTIATMASDGGIKTQEGYKVAPLLQGGAHVNPCYVGNIKGTMRWTGSSYADRTGTWTWTRSEAGESVVIDRPTAIRTDFDIHRNAPHLAIIYIGQNGGYNDLDDLVRQHRLMIEHANAQHTIILGFSSGTAAGRSAYESRMKKEFGRYFVSLREYLAHPIYNGTEMVSCWGLADQGLEPGTKEYNGTTYDALTEIASGTVPHQILADSVHYTNGTKTVIGNMLYKKCCELNIF